MHMKDTLGRLRFVMTISEMAEEVTGACCRGLPEAEAHGCGTEAGREGPLPQCGDCGVPGGAGYCQLLLP